MFNALERGRRHAERRAGCLFNAEVDLNVLAEQICEFLRQRGSDGFRARETDAREGLVADLEIGFFDLHAGWRIRQGCKPR